MNKRIRKKIEKRTPKIYVNDKRYFKPDDISIGSLRAYAVYVPPSEKKRKRVRV